MLFAHNMYIYRQRQCYLHTINNMYIERSFCPAAATNLKPVWSSSLASLSCSCPSAHSQNLSTLHKVRTFLLYTKSDPVYSAQSSYLSFFTQPQIEAKKCYTWKCVNARQKLSCNKTAKINSSVKFWCPRQQSQFLFKNIQCVSKYTHFVNFTFFACNVKAIFCVPIGKFYTWLKKLFPTSLSGLLVSQTWVNTSDIHSIIQQTVLFSYQIWGVYYGLTFKCLQMISIVKV